MTRTQHITLAITFEDDAVVPPSKWDWHVILPLAAKINVDVVCTRDVESKQLAYEDLSPKALFHLIYGDPNFARFSPVLAPRDCPIERIKLVDYALGEFIKRIDTGEEYFHVELHPPRAEIWSAQAWRESLTRRARLKPIATEEDTLVSLRRSVQQELTEIIGKAGRCNFEVANGTAMALIYYRHNDVMIDLLKLSPALKKKLFTLREMLDAQGIGAPVIEPNETENG